jgi:hypothetical protein
MGYECPVCGVVEADDEHLANHLAFTALVRGGDHEEFLDDHVPDWADRDPESLASDVVEYATETDDEPGTDPVAEGHDHETPAVERTGQADLSGEAAEILDEAQRLTEAMIGDSDQRDGSEAASDEGDADSENE